MPKENFKKEQELLRLLWLRRRRLPSPRISFRTRPFRRQRGSRPAGKSAPFWKTKPFSQTLGPKKETYYFFTRQQADSTPWLAYIACVPCGKASLERYLAIISILSTQPSSFQELLNEICRLSYVNEEDQHAYKKTLVNYLAVLRRAGFIQRQPSQRGKYYLPSAWLISSLPPSWLL